MNLIIVAEVLIHFAGLSVVSSEFPNDPGVKIIMPRVQHVTMRDIEARPVAAHAGHASDYQLVAQSPQERRRPVPFNVTPQAFDSYHIEDHQAMLIFKLDGAGQTNWPITPMKGADKDYGYVLLNGERVEFRTSAVNEPADMSKIALPRLRKTCCAAMTDLSPAFVKPYPGAAAVFDISQGRMSACNVRTSPEDKRRDTEIYLRNNGAYLFVIGRTATTTRQLRIPVRPGETAELIASNLPAAYLSGHRVAPLEADLNGRPHRFAYYDMGKNASKCGMTLTECMNKDFAPAQECRSTMSVSFVGQMNKPLSKDGFVEPDLFASNFECSNSQWP